MLHAPSFLESSSQYPFLSSEPVCAFVCRRLLCQACPPPERGFSFCVYFSHCVAVYERGRAHSECERSSDSCQELTLSFHRGLWASVWIYFYWEPSGLECPRI